MTEDEEPFEPTGAGTVEEPYSIADVLGLIEEGETSDEMVYVSGIVSEISEVSPLSVTSGHATYFISDDGTTENQIEVFDGLYLGGLDFDAEDEIKVGDEVVVYGYLEMVDETPEITNSMIYSLNGETYQEPELTYIDGYEYVGLGLSVLWATCNIGAETRKAYGNYYAWGEIETKDTYSYSTSVTYNKEDMEDFSGNAEYDAATANWGSKWRMPTSAEYGELIENCTILALTGENNSRVAWKFTSTVNGNSIVFSKPGYYYKDYIAGTSCLYWTSTPVADSAGWYSYMFAVYYEANLRSAEQAPRYYGLPIRPVADKEN